MKQAVVIIHGVGEQVPMETLRGFADAVLAGEPRIPRYYSKPDDMSDSFELRRLQTSGRVRTHFYEYYWAYHVEGTRLFDVLGWLAALALRRARDVPHGARALWITARLLGLAVVALATTGVLGGGLDWFRTQPPFTASWIGVLILVGVIQGFLVGYLGDAARYFSPRPRNIKLRQRIRSDGVRLLRTLHERGEYDRIVVVGHSLGSVIGYDVLTHLWPSFSTRYPGLADPGTKQSLRDWIDQGRRPQQITEEDVARAGAALPGEDGALGTFREAQNLAFREQRRLGSDWRVTDFITAGSPLTNAMLFLSRSRAEFEDRKSQRELPTCPPQREDEGYGYTSEYPVRLGDGVTFRPFILHHAALFAVTRWTNLYFPAALGLLGDFVGGPLQPALGPGIRDVAVRTRKWSGFAGRTILAHNLYWHAGDAAEEAGAAGAPPKRPLALSALRDALDLDARVPSGPLAWD